MRILFLGNWNSAHHRRWINYYIDRGHECALCTRHPASADELPVYSIQPLSNERRGMLSNLCVMASDALVKANHMPDIIARGLYHYRAGRAIRRLIGSYDPDMVVVIYAWPDALYVPRYSRPVSVLFSIGTDILKIDNLCDKLMLKRALDRFDLIVAPSKQMVGVIDGWLTPPRRASLFRYGIDLEHVGRFRREDNASSSRVIYARGFIPIYDADTAFRGVAMASQHIKDIELVVTSAHGSKPAGIDPAIMAVLGRRVKSTGNVSIEEVYSLMAGSRTYLSSSLSDGASIALMEAMYLGCLPVVSDIPANREWIVHGDNGLLFEPRNPANLAECLSRAMTDDELFRRARDTNIGMIEKECDQLRNFGRLESTMTGMIANKMVNL